MSVEMNKSKYIQNVLVFLGIILAGLIYSKYKKTTLESSAKYSIAQVTNTFWAKGGNSCEYSFIVNGVIYIGKEFVYDNRPVINERYIVKYDSNNPNNSEILLAIKILDTSMKAPVNGGWESPPQSIDGNSTN